MKFPNLSRLERRTSFNYDEPKTPLLESVKPFCFGQKKDGLTDIYGNTFDKNKCLGCKYSDGCDTALWHETSRYKKVLRVRRRIKRITRGRVPAEREDDLIRKEPKVMM